MTTTVEDAPGTPVVIGGTRGGPDKPTLRKDRWWIEPAVTATILTAFVIYSTFAAFMNRDYYAGPALHRNLISPLDSPCLTGGCDFFVNDTTTSFASRLRGYLNVTSALAEIQQDMRLVRLREGEAKDPGPRRRRHLGFRVEVIEINAVITGRRFLRFLVVD